MKPPPDNETPDGIPRFGFLEIAVLVLSVYVLGALLASLGLGQTESNLPLAEQGSAVNGT